MRHGRCLGLTTCARSLSFPWLCYFCCHPFTSIWHHPYWPCIPSPLPNGLWVLVLSPSPPLLQPILHKILPISWINCLCYSRANLNDLEEGKKIQWEFAVNSQLISIESDQDSVLAVSAVEELCKCRLNLGHTDYSSFHCDTPLILFLSNQFLLNYAKGQFEDFAPTLLRKSFYYAIKKEEKHKQCVMRTGPQICCCASSASLLVFGVVGHT